MLLLRAWSHKWVLCKFRTHGGFPAWLLQYFCSSCWIIMALNFAATLGRLPMLENNDRISLPLICSLSLSPESVLLLICFHASWWVNVSMVTNAGASVTADLSFHHLFSQWASKVIWMIKCEYWPGLEGSFHCMSWCGQVSNMGLSFNGARFLMIWLIMIEQWSSVWLICFDAWWWMIFSLQGRAAGYQCLSISGCWPWVIFNAWQCKKSWAVAGCFSMEYEAELILNILICLLMSESVSGKPSFTHGDAWTGVWQGRSFTKAGSYVAQYTIWALHVQSAGCGLKAKLSRKAAVTVAGRL